MRKITVLIIILASTLVCFSNNDAMRQELDKAWKDEKSCDDLLKKLETKGGKEITGYIGVVYVMKSNHFSLPLKKYNYFQKGKKMLEGAIKEMPHNIEFIYYRYEIQMRIPKILSYDNLKEDRAKLQNYLANASNKTLDVNLYSQILKQFQTKK